MTQDGPNQKFRWKSYTCFRLEIGIGVGIDIDIDYIYRSIRISHRFIWQLVPEVSFRCFAPKGLPKIRFFPPFQTAGRESAQLVYWWRWKSINSVKRFVANESQGQPSNRYTRLVFFFEKPLIFYKVYILNLAKTPLKKVKITSQSLQDHPPNRPRRRWSE